MRSSRIGETLIPGHGYNMLAKAMGGLSDDQLAEVRIRKIGVVFQ